jgi:hypothetical protein
MPSESMSPSLVARVALRPIWGSPLRTLSSFTSEDAWFAPFRDGLLRGRASRPPGTVLQDLGCTAENCQAVLDTLAGLVKDVAMELAPLALKRDIDLAYEGIGHALAIQGNAPMLREMVSNLIDNAIRYSSPDSAVTVAAWHCSASDSSISGQTQ